MSKYMFLFRGGVNNQEASPEQMQASMMKWKVWMETLTAKGKMLGGEPLEGGGRVLSGKDKKVTDGPFAESKEVVGGYLIVKAGGLEQGVRVGAGCPIFEVGGSVEVRPLMSMSM